MALTSVWQLMQSKSAKKNKKAAVDLDYIQSVSRLSHNSVSYYVELLLIEELGELKNSNNQEALAAINEHPLIQWEKATQDELCQFLTFAAENKQSCDMAKKMSLEEGLSSLGIEIA